MIFGSASSPYILGATFEKHINQYKAKYPQTLKDLEENTYVDDLQAVCDTAEELVKFKEEATHIMREGKVDSSCTNGIATHPLMLAPSATRQKLKTQLTPKLSLELNQVRQESLGFHGTLIETSSKSIW